ncbi:acyl-CoA thioesterase [Pseudotabrizicola sp. L79]|uniref:acyl-CoA thioesterase n=1 Tax=Pseudotabrizicola sp. L79 TaxID=3118402 RepID=UPI002F928FB6
MAQEAFLFPRRIFFGDCDLLGIAFTGRITNFAIEAIEAFWDELLDGCGWLYLLTEEKIAIPFVHLTFDFISPVKAGLQLVCEVRVQKVGASSVGLQVFGRQGQTTCFDCRSTSVFMDATSFSKIPITDNIREALLICLTIPAS